MVVLQLVIASAMVLLHLPPVLRSLQDLNSGQGRVMRYALYSTLLFIFFTLIGGFIMISHITKPLSSLAAFLDRVDVVDDLPLALGQAVAARQHIAAPLQEPLQRLGRMRQGAHVRQLEFSARGAGCGVQFLTESMEAVKGRGIRHVLILE